MLFSAIIITLIILSLNINVQIEHEIILLVFLGYLISRISRILKNIYPDLKQRFKTREKLDLSHDFKWHYFMFLNSLFITMISFYLMLMVNTTYILLMCFGLFFSYVMISYIMNYKKDIKKLDVWKNNMVKKCLSSMAYQIK